MNLHIEDILEYENWKNSINRQKLEGINWYYDGEKVNIADEDVIETFKYTGLSNLDFAFWLLDKIYEEDNE
ncbi:hypothetical protein D3C80_2111850 [compost metagenome]